MRWPRLLGLCDSFGSQATAQPRPLIITAAEAERPLNKGRQALAGVPEGRNS